MASSPRSRAFEVCAEAIQVDEAKEHENRVTFAKSPSILPDSNKDTGKLILERPFKKLAPSCFPS